MPWEAPRRSHNSFAALRRRRHGFRMPEPAISPMRAGQLVLHDLHMFELRPVEMPLLPRDGKR